MCVKRNVVKRYASGEVRMCRRCHPSNVQVRMCVEGKVRDAAECRESLTPPLLDSDRLDISWNRASGLSMLLQG